MIGRLVLLLVFSLYTICTSAQADGKRVYTKDNPLVYEDTWNLWPYSFLNEQGEPEGYNIDLLKLMMSKLDIPYVIKLKSRQEVLEDLKSGKCDLTVYMTTELYKGALYGKAPIMLFTQSVATPKNKPVTIKTFRDLNKKGQKVMVYENSLCHQLMLDYGMIANAIVKSDMSEVIKRVNDKGEGQIVWNTLSLKWLIYNYQLDNLVLSPVNMPHGECRYMANDQNLLDLLDNTYSNIYAGEELVPLEKKWFYPEKDVSKRIAWEWYVVWIASILLVIIIISLLSLKII
ncbi:MAG: transporter substrate-binding domain-containing protein [Prevotella sp.]|nr:transporter substrate-binding domain-containing protein [Prevotella sp.]